MTGFKELMMRPKTFTLPLEPTIALPSIRTRVPDHRNRALSATQGVANTRAIADATIVVLPSSTSQERRDDNEIATKLNRRTAEEHRNVWGTMPHTNVRHSRW